MQINIKACSKLILLSLVGVTRHADSIQNDYAVSLEYIKDELNDESDFLDADKHFFFFCMLVLYFDGFCRACLKYPYKFAISLRYLKKEVRKILIFWYVRRPPNHVNQSLLQMINFILKMKLET